MGGGLSAYDIVNAGEKLDLKAIAVFNDPEEDGGEGCDIDQDDGDLGNTALTHGSSLSTAFAVSWFSRRANGPVPHGRATACGD